MRSKLGISTFLLLFPLLASSEQMEMQSISRFLEGEKTPGPTAAQFVSLRCGALLNMLAAYTKDNGLPEKAAQFRTLADVAVASAIKTSKPPSEEFILGQIKLMTEGYTQRWLKAKALTGNFSDDLVIQSDLPVCLKVFGNVGASR